MEKGFVAKASVVVNAAATEVWHALVTPELITRYFFGTTVVSEWKEGTPIVWHGEWQGKSYEDKGRILKFQPHRILQYSHFSPLSGLPDTLENYHTVTIELSGEDAATRVSLTQDNNPTEQARDHSQRNWETVLTGLKQLLES